MKCCSRCKKRKPKSEFYKNKNSPDGLGAYCKECTRDSSRKWGRVHPKKVAEINGKYRKAHPEKIKERARKYYKANSEKVKESSRKWVKANPKKAKEIFRRWGKAHPERMKELVRKHTLKKLYGLTPAEYDRMFKAQGGVCAICGEPECTQKNLPIDHNHTTGKTRELVCSRCNIAIGMIDDDPVKAQKMAAYLTKHSQKKKKARK